MDSLTIFYRPSTHLTQIKGLVSREIGVLPWWGRQTQKYCIKQVGKLTRTIDHTLIIL